MVVITRWRHDVSMAPATCLSQVILVVAFLPFASPGEIGGGDVVWLAALGIGQIGLGFALLTVGARLIPAAQVGLITLLEVVLGPALGVARARRAPEHAHARRRGDRDRRDRDPDARRAAARARRGPGAAGARYGAGAAVARFVLEAGRRAGRGTPPPCRSRCDVLPRRLGNAGDPGSWRRQTLAASRPPRLRDWSLTPDHLGDPIHAFAHRRDYALRVVVRGDEP